MQLEGSLSQTSNSVPPSPERGVSPSPSFSEFNYQRQLPHHFSSSVRQPRPNTAEHTASRKTDSSSLDLPAPSTQTVSSRYPLAESATDVVTSASTSAHLSLTAAPSHSNEPKQREQSSLATSERQHEALRAATSRSSFQLQPVPPPKRRRFDDVSSTSAEHVCHDLQRIDETRRSSDAGIAADQKQGYARLPSSEHPQTLQTRSVPQGSSKQAGLGYSSAHIGSAASAATSGVLAAPVSDLGTHVAAGPQKQRQVRQLDKAALTDKVATPSAMHLHLQRWLSLVSRTFRSAQDATPGSRTECAESACQGDLGHHSTIASSSRSTKPLGQLRLVSCSPRS